MSNVSMTLGSSNIVTLANEAALAASAPLRARRDELHKIINDARAEVVTLTAQIREAERVAFKAKVEG